MTCLGDELIVLLGSAQKEVKIIAPFIRSSALTRLLDAIQESVRVSIVTRWRPLDVVAGASDLAVFNLTQERSIPLFLLHALHAKLFIADDACLIGSANITDTALGWRAPSNLELLVPIDLGASEVGAFLSDLMSGVILATQDHHQQMVALVEDLASRSDLLVPEVTDFHNGAGGLPTTWLPTTMNPDELYLVYLQGSGADVSRSALPDMIAELSLLNVPPGMSRLEFVSWVAASISQTRIVTNILGHIETHGSVNESTLVDILTDMGVALSAYTPKDTLRTLQRWLTYFLSSRYETTAETVKLIRASTLGENV